ERGWTELSASCADERDAPLPALGTILNTALADAPAASPAARRRGRQVSSLLAARGDQDAAETAARFLVERAAEGACLVLLVEDVQYANSATMRVLASVSRVVAES